MRVDKPLPSAWGGPVVHALLKTTPTDFRVAEQLDIALDGAGEHLYLHLRKRDLNTQAVADWLQQRLAVTSADIGYSGLKDKRAITDQWFSIRTPLSAAELDLSTEQSDGGVAAGVTVLDWRRHGRKLRRGTHRANRFDITLRQTRLSLASGDMRTHVADRLACIAASGFPNYFGPQRFGIGGANLTRAREHIARKRKRLSRQRRGFYLSAIRSALFNEICAARVTANTWQTLLPGEPVMLAGSKSFFVDDGTDPSVQRRLEQLDVHPSGPLWGRGDTPATDDCASIEAGVLAGHVDSTRWLADAGLDQERRALRARATDLQWDWLDESTLRIQMELEKGVYATSLLAELMPESCLR